MDDFNSKKIRAVALYTFLTAGAVLLVYFGLLHLSVVLHYAGNFVDIVMKVLSPLILAFVIAYLLNPAILFYEKLMHKAFPRLKYKRLRALSVIEAVLSFLILLTLVISLLVFSVTRELQVGDLSGLLLIATNFLDGLNKFYEASMQWLADMHLESPDLQSLFRDISDTIYGTLNKLISDLTGSLGNISGNFAAFLFGVVMSIYMMLDGRRITDYLKRVADVIFKEQTNESIRELLSDLHHAFFGYLRGQLLDVLFMIITVSIALQVTGCRFAIGIGLLAGLGNLIPYLGPFIGYGLTALVCLIYGDYSVLAVSLPVLLVIQLIDGNIVGPRLLGKSISVHPLLILLFLIAGGAVGGIAGMLLAVPVGGFITIRFRKWLDRNESNEE
jgi:predicted PurR-regulated permease PerM